MRVIVNGESVRIEEDSAAYSLQALLRHLGYLVDEESGRQPFVVALNQKIVAAAHYAQTSLQEDDCIDILAAVTGG